MNSFVSPLSFFTTDIARVIDGGMPMRGRRMGFQQGSGTGAGTQR